jgi:hypothetical protein
VYSACAINSRTGHCPTSGTYPRQSRQAIIFRLAALFLAVSLNHLASAETYIGPGRSCPAPQLETASKMLLAVLCNWRPTMSAQIIKASVSLVAVATSAVSFFVISWIGLALLGF